MLALQEVLQAAAAAFSHAHSTALSSVAYRPCKHAKGNVLLLLLLLLCCRVLLADGGGVCACQQAAGA
jgi:hypothetical protein